MTSSPSLSAAGTAAVWLTTADRTHLLSRDTAHLADASTSDSAHVTIDVDAQARYQTVFGWGAAITDASAFLIQTKLGAAEREALLRELFGEGGGLGLSFMRVPMGASDFSRSHYSYDDVPAGERDTALAHFSIAPDRAHKLPLLKRMRAINPELRLVGSPWSAPGWMKSTESLVKGTLLPQYYPAFAAYTRKWIDAYAAEGIPFFAVTLQNEPHFEPDGYPGMRLDPPQRAELIARHVGPLFASSGIPARILDWDHNWDQPESPLGVLGDSAARPFIAGVAWHCYSGDIAAQQAVHERYPDKETYFTECSGGNWAPVWGDNLQWLVRTMVIGNARSWAKGVALWNLALDENHGPHLGGCNDCRGLVTIDSRSGAVTRNEEYYALGHASRFVRPGAVRIASTTSAGVETVAFANLRDGGRVMIALNASGASRDVVVREGTRRFGYRLPAASVATFTWK